MRADLAEVPKLRLGGILGRQHDVDEAHPDSALFSWYGMRGPDDIDEFVPQLRGAEHSGPCSFPAETTSPIPLDPFIDDNVRITAIEPPPCDDTEPIWSTSATRGRPARSTLRPFVVQERWVGVVDEVDDLEFGAQLTSRIDSASPPVRATFLLEELNASDRSIVRPGSGLYWTVGYRHHNGVRTRASELVLQRIVRDVTPSTATDPQLLRALGLT